MRFDRKKFFERYRTEFGALTQSQVNGIEQLLGFIEADPYVKTVEVGAFLLATPKHETADTFKPIHEYGGKAYFIKRYGGQTRKGKELGNDTQEEGFDYAGKGYPQTTGESNYERLEDAIRAEYSEVVAEFERRTGKRFDLTVGDQPNDKADPQNMLDPAIAYVSMSYGSRVGLFTGRKLSQYDLKTPQGRKGSRRIINGQDKAALIAGYIESFIKILKASKTSAAGPETDTAQSATENVSNDPVSDSPHSTAQPPTSTESKVSIWERMGKWKEKLDSVSSFKDSINPFTPSLSPISGMSWMGTVTTKLGGWLTFIIGLFTNNPLYILAGVALVAIGIICLVMAKRNAASRGGGGATATAVVEVNQ